MMKKLYLHVAVAALMVLPAGSALAAGEMDGLKGLYGGASFGRSEGEDVCTDANEAGYINCDDTKDGWKIFAGYQFTPNWGLEAAYVDLGEFTASGETYSGSVVYDGDLIEASATPKAKAKVDGFSLALVGTAPYSEQFSVFAKAGAYFWNLENKEEIEIGNVSINGDSYPQTGTVHWSSISDDGTSLLLGIGAKFNFTPNVGMRAEWEWYQDIGERETTGKTDINLLSLGLFATF